ncbi:MAG: class I poly(R)-hydroxyalkanoic acid synthase [Pseudomonadota bacterium]
MTTEGESTGTELDALSHKLHRIEELSRRVVSVLSHQRRVPPGLQGPSPDLFMKAATAYMTEVMSNPAKILEHQITFWGKTLKHHVEAQQALASGTLAAPEDRTEGDNRFRGDLWKTHPYFNYIKQQYLLSSKAISEAISDLDGLDERDKKRLDYFSRQIVDMLSPANFLGTNPEALARAVATDGQSLVDGLENLVRDLEANDGNLIVTLADREAFKVGDNLGSTPGKVVFRNRMFELIQYAPQTEKVRRVPLIVFPPWINKFYILDLKEKNSLINWIVSQGYTLFVVSWINPDVSYSDVGMDDYVVEGYLAAIDTVKRITGEKQVNAVGYCIAGTTLSLTLALMTKRKDKSIKSATFFTTLTDFSDQGEVGVFLDDNFVDAIEEEVNREGLLNSFYMSRTFSFLRSNDLIYGPAIKSYMMGEAPPAFDLLFWNGDSTNLPARMSVEYLRGLCQRDEFASDGFEICGGRVKIGDVDVPLFAVGCETDHIAAWDSSYRGVQKMGSKQKTFIVSESGHIAGIVNPPSRNKYGHFSNEDLSLEPDDWMKTASYTSGSWWPRWEEWLRARSGALVEAREPGSAHFPALGDAPGQYVLVAE